MVVLRRKNTKMGVGNDMCVVFIGLFDRSIDAEKMERFLKLLIAAKISVKCVKISNIECIGLPSLLIKSTLWITCGYS